MWPDELRRSIVRRLFENPELSYMKVADEAGIPHTTVWRWRAKARRLAQSRHAEGMTNKDVARRSRDWLPIERLKVVTETAGLEGEELGSYLREHGLHAATVEQWRADALSGLGGGAAPRGKRKVSRKERALQRELHRKEKALAEVAALLVLQKKLNGLFTDQADDGSDEP